MPSDDPQPQTSAAENRSAVYVCAVRYALGRQTYMPELVAGQVANDVDRIIPSDRKVIARDIRDELRLRKDHTAADVLAWRRALEALSDD